MPDHMTKNKAKERLREATLSEDDTLLKVLVTGSFFPHYMTTGWDHIQDSDMSSRRLA